jgi:hypothetical protein
MFVEIKTLQIALHYLSLSSYQSSCWHNQLMVGDGYHG